MQDLYVHYLVTLPNQGEKSLISDGIQQSTADTAGWEDRGIHYDRRLCPCIGRQAERMMEVPNAHLARLHLGMLYSMNSFR